MFNLDRAIADWRRKMAAGGVSNHALLDELESHLRGEARTLVSAGMPEAEAFQLAISRLGNPGPLRAEFRKVKNPACWPVTLCSWLFVAGIILFAGFLAKRLLAGRLGLLLGAHILSVTAGYGAAFLAGGFGIFFVICRMFRSLSPDRQQALDRAVRIFSQIAAGLVIAGFALGMLWAHQHLGRYFTGNAKEIGCLCVFVWLVLLSLMQRSGRVSDRVTMLMCIGGNIMVSLAWFGAAILVNGQKMLIGTVSYLPLLLSVLLGVHLVFLVMGLAPAPAPSFPGHADHEPIGR